MKLGVIHMPMQQQIAESSGTTAAHLTLADSLDFHIAYLPGQSPQNLLEIGARSTTSINLALDAKAFGRLTPRDMEGAVRTLNESLEERLFLGIDICCHSSCAKQRAQAQEFETMFSQDIAHPHQNAQSHFPMKRPCPKILGLPMQGTAQEASFAAAHGYLPLTPSYLGAKDVARHWPAIVSGATSALRRANPQDWQVARNIVVHDDRAAVEAYVYGPKSPIRQYYNRLKDLGLLTGDIDTHLRTSVIAGSAQRVAEKLLSLRETVGTFGTLHLIQPAGHDPEMTQHTMRQMAENVLPRMTSTDICTLKELEKT